MDGKKMSKSMGNIIPLREAIKDYGADPIRLAIIISAELLQDADFNLESVNTIKSRLENMLEECMKYKLGTVSTTESEDRWILARLNNLILQVTSAVEKMRLREALHHILFSFESELQWYFKRTQAKQRTNVSGILHKILSVRVAMLSLFAPHIAEEMWEKLGNPGLVSRSAWPQFDSQVDQRSIQVEDLLMSIINDIKNILKITKISPQKIIIYTADKWKGKAYQKIVQSVVNGQTNIGAIIKDLIADKETENIKKDPDFVKKVVNAILAEPVELRKLKAEMQLIDEDQIIRAELSSLVKKEFDIELETFSESDPARYDPKNKAKTARPFKPALLIE
jgi:leucyl-tRNA synthetase